MGEIQCPRCHGKGKVTETLGEFLQRKRVEKGFTLREVAETTGYSNPAISQIETGRTIGPSIYMVAALCELYGVPLTSIPMQQAEDSTS